MTVKDLRSPSLPAPATRLGALLRQWRAARRVSQLDLALEAGVSTRHLSYVETGKAQPSRDMVARLADTLDVPLRERNALLVAAGYAPEFPERALDTPELAPIRRAIELIVEHQEPYPAFVLDRRWDVQLTNRAAGRVAGFLIGGSRHTNMVRQFFDPADMRAVVVNWEEVAGDTCTTRSRRFRRMSRRTRCWRRCSAIPACHRGGTREIWVRHPRRFSRCTFGKEIRSCDSSRPSRPSAGRWM